MKKMALLLALLMGPASGPMRPDADADGNDGRGNLEFREGQEVSPSIKAARQRPRLPSGNQTAPPSAIFFDDTFNDSDWELMVFLSSPNAGSSTASQQSSGGNPGAFRRVNITVNGAMYGSTRVYGIHLKRGAAFSPAITGPITSIDYSEDALYLGGSTESGQLTGPALRQGGKFYVAANIVAPFTGNWTTLILSNLRASQFVQVNALAGFIDSNSHPDFSSSGARIDLGFVRAKSATAAYQSSFGIDNWRLTVSYSLPPGCNFLLSPIGQAFPAAGGTGSVQMTAGTGCNWTAMSNANWITITSGSSGSGVGTINYQVAQNTGAARAGTVAITGGELTVTQADGQSSCTFSISPSSHTFPGSGGTSVVRLTTQPGCAWTVSGTAPWMTVLGYGGIGTGDIQYGVTTNTGSPRTATITIAGQPFTVNQDGGTPGCSYTLSPTSASVPADPLGDNLLFVNVITGQGCSWTALSQSPWIHPAARSEMISGTRSVAFYYDNNGGAPRSGTINFGGQTFTVSQAGLCSADKYQVSPDRVVVSADGGSVDLQVFAPPECSWVPRVNVDWITIFNFGVNTGKGTFSLQVAKETGFGRSGDVTVGGKSVGVFQNDPDAEHACFLSLVLFLLKGGGEKIALLRSFRDEVLAATPQGRQYTDLYYKFSGEAIKQLMFSPTLLLQTRQVLERHQQLIESMIGGKGAILGKADLEEVEALLDSFASGASPEFATALKQLRRDLRDPKVHAQFGVKVQ